MRFSIFLAEPRKRQFFVPFGMPFGSHLASIWSPWAALGLPMGVQRALWVHLLEHLFFSSIFDGFWGSRGGPGSKWARRGEDAGNSVFATLTPRVELPCRRELIFQIPGMPTPLREVNLFTSLEDLSENLRDPEIRRKDTV